MKYMLDDVGYPDCLRCVQTVVGRLLTTITHVMWNQFGWIVHISSVIGMVCRADESSHNADTVCAQGRKSLCILEPTPGVRRLATADEQSAEIDVVLSQEDS
jgi:hypothetical protein